MSNEMTGLAPVERGSRHGAPEAIDVTQVALFLDFDGTLVDLADTPDGIDVPKDLAELLNTLHSASGGAVAVVSGRAAGTIEQCVPDYRGDIIGSHGAERRIAGERGSHRLAGSPEVTQIQDGVRTFAERDPDFLVEDKPCGVVLHFRRNPDLQPEAQRFMESVIGRFQEFKLQPAKMAIEIKPADIGKAASIRWLHDRDPYRGRRPVYFGDDATDEPAMEYCIEAGGAAVKVGDGETVADHHLETVGEVRAALAQWARAAEGQS